MTKRDPRKRKKPRSAQVTDSKQGSILFWTSLLINAFQVLQKNYISLHNTIWNPFFPVFFVVVVFFSKNVQSEQKFPILYKTQWTLKSDSSITF